MMNLERFLPNLNFKLIGITATILSLVVTSSALAAPTVDISMLKSGNYAAAQSLPFAGKNDPTLSAVILNSNLGDHPCYRNLQVDSENASITLVFMGWCQPSILNDSNFAGTVSTFSCRSVNDLPANFNRGTPVVCAENEIQTLSTEQESWGGPSYEKKTEYLYPLADGNFIVQTYTVDNDASPFCILPSLDHPCTLDLGNGYSSAVFVPYFGNPWFKPSADLFTGDQMN